MNMAKEVKREQLAELLYSAMKRRNMSVQALASAVGVQRQTCYAWLHEYQRPGLEMLRRLALVLNIPLAQLIAASYQDVSGARLESLLQIYLGLPEEKRRLLEAVAIVFGVDNQQTAD
ncbi:MAG TPA: helix-turn-helix transcriptional regulator [Ktedonobacteraceae bacterium]|nr:helix-turn-helix transcriptional regulator [Ktedonobacteraceae bacterium]